MLLIVLYIGLLLPNNNFSYLDEEIEEEFEPQCDMDYDGETDCRMFLSFASTNWHQNDYRGCIFNFLDNFFRKNFKNKLNCK